MAKENIRRTRITVALIIVGAVIMLAAVGVVFIFPSLKSRLSPGYLQDELSSGKYVSLSGLERGDSVYVYDNYLVKRSREGWGTDRIEIYSTWSDPDETTASTLSRKGLRVYIKDNAKDLRRFVLTEIMSEAKIKAAEESKNGSD